jgi:hypothetical protein
MSAHAIRMPPARPRRRRWPSRILGLLATAALLGSGAAIAAMVMPERDVAVVPEAPAATPAPIAKKEPGGLTAAQKQARHAAAVTMREQGYEPVRLADWKPAYQLRVMVGRADTGALRAFFFVKREFVGNDDPSSSGKLRVASIGKRGVTLAYGLAAGGTEKVRFEWRDGQLTPIVAVPPVTLR